MPSLCPRGKPVTKITQSRFNAPVTRARLLQWRGCISYSQFIRALLCPIQMAHAKVLSKNG